MFIRNSRISWRQFLFENAPLTFSVNKPCFIFAARPDCSQKYEPVGCFASNAGAMPEIMVNDIFPEMAQFSGKMLTFGEKWTGQISNLICRCAEKVAEKNYISFGITADGKCFSSIIELVYIYYLNCPCDEISKKVFR